MKNVLVFSLFIVLYIVQASSRPNPQEDPSVFDKIRHRAEDALKVAQDATNRTLEYAKHAVENGWHTAQQTAQRGIEAGKNWTQHASQDLTKLATATVPTGASAYEFRQFKHQPQLLSYRPSLVPVAGEKSTVSLKMYA